MSKSVCSRYLQRLHCSNNCSRAHPNKCPRGVLVLDLENHRCIATCEIKPDSCKSYVSRNTNRLQSLKGDSSFIIIVLCDGW